MSNRVTLNGKEMFPARYFTAQDLTAGKAFQVEIRAVTKEKMHNPTSNKDEEKWVIYFLAPKKGTVLGDEFAESIAQALTETRAEKWIGQKVIIERKQVRRDKEGIRARAIATNNAAKTAPVVDDDDADDGDTATIPTAK